MRLCRVRVVGLGALSDLTLSLLGEDEAPRPLVVLFGGDGTGKSTLLNAIAHTRPGYALPPLPRPRPRLQQQEERKGFVVAEWALGDDDLARPHPLLVTSPNAAIEGETDNEAVLRRREQALFDKRAQDHGFAFVAISGARWFSRTAVMLSSPERTVAKYDPRASVSFDDASRSDLTRDTKQIYSYAAIARALEARTEAPRIGQLDLALREVAAVLLEPFGARYEGADPGTLEPIFAINGGPLVLFDDLPRGARHLLAIGALATRALYGAYEGDPLKVREREGVVLVDDLESMQDAVIAKLIPHLLARALPRVQWITATSHASVTMSCDRGEVIALRRAGDRLELHEGPLATLH